jgi:DNA helicase HerA-like ATPase
LIKQDNIGIVVSGTFNQGINIKLNSQSDMESVTIGSHIVIDTKQNRFMCEVADIKLTSTDQRIEQLPIHMHNETIFNSLRDNAAYGIIEVIPRLLLKKDSPLGKDEEPEELPGANTIPPHFSPVFKPTEADYNQIFHTKDGVGFNVGSPMDLNTQINLDMELLVRRSSAIFGKSGSGKSFLTRILLAGMIQKSNTASLVFDYAGEYGYESASENGSTVKGLAQLFSQKVYNYTINESKAKNKKFGAVYLSIPRSQITATDIVTSAAELDLNANQVEGIHQIYDQFRYVKGGDWINHFLRLENETDEMNTFKNSTYTADATIEAIKRRFARIARLQFLTSGDTETNVIEELIEKLKLGNTVILDFPKDQLSYILLANMLTRRIHRQWQKMKDDYVDSINTDNPKKDPVSLVICIEEAHNFLNKDVSNRTIFGKIAREARKYNVTLMVVDQRPSGIDDEIISQIENKFICKLDNSKDIDAIFTGIHQSASLKTSLRSIQSNQHALAFGEAIPMPIIFKVRNYGQTFYKEIGADDEPLFSPEDAGI